jgi:methylated-DNA-[protein]-cysteine S-methyltransferase
MPGNFPRKKEVIKMKLFFKRMPSLIGEIRIYATDTAVVGLRMAEEVHKDRDRSGNLPGGEANEVVRKAAEELKAFFAGRLKKFTVPVEVSGTDFQKEVWKTLQGIEYGHLRTYAEVARTIARHRAVRAVGRAIGSNPVPILIPCHRVIGSDASLTGFGGGLAAKQALLELEGHRISHLKLSIDPSFPFAS